MCLHCRHFHSKDLLRLRRQLLDDVLLQPSQHECSQFVVQILDLGFLIHVIQIKVVGQLDCRQLNLKVKLTFLGHEEMHQRQQLLDIVLQRGTGDEQPRCGGEAFQSFVELTLVVLQPMRLVDSKRLPFDLSQLCTIFEDKFVGREQDVELEILQRSKLKLPDDVSGSGRTHVANHVEIRSPDPELHLPGRYGRERNDDKEWAILTLCVEQVGEEGYRLDSFTQAHLTSADFKID